MRGSAGRAGWQQPWPHPALELPWGGQAEAGGGRGRAPGPTGVVRLRQVEDVKSSQVIFISRAHLKTTDVDQSALHTRLIQAKTGQTQRSIKTSEWE